VKVVFVIAGMAGGGSERVISILANEFIKRDIEVTIMMTIGHEVAYLLDEKISLIRIGDYSGGSILNRLVRIKRMRQIFKANKDTIIISFGPDTSLYTVFAALFLGNRVIISERNDPAICPYPYRLRNLLYRRAECLVFQTKDCLDCFPRYIRKKGYLIGNPLSEAKPFPERSRSSVTQYEIVAVGRLEPQKNYGLLLEAFALYCNMYPLQCKLTIYGKGYMLAELERRAIDLNIDKKVIFAGFEPNVMEKIKNSNLFVLSSDYEGISNSLLEAMAIGLPVISTDCPIGGSKELISPGENGILVPVGDAKALAEAILHLVENPELAAQMGNEAKKVRELYSTEAVTAKWLEILERL